MQSSGLDPSEKMSFTTEISNKITQEEHLQGSSLLDPHSSLRHAKRRDLGAAQKDHVVRSVITDTTY